MSIAYSLVYQCISHHKRHSERKQWKSYKLAFKAFTTLMAESMHPSKLEWTNPSPPQMRKGFAWRVICPGLPEKASVTCNRIHTRMKSY